jgi:hypothetical protein
MQKLRKSHRLSDADLSRAYIVKMRRI